MRVLLRYEVLKLNPLRTFCKPTEHSRLQGVFGQFIHRICMNDTELGNTVKKISTWAIIIGVVVFGFLWLSSYSEKKERQRASEEKRSDERKAELLAKRDIESRVFNTEKGQLVVIDVPLPSTLSSHIVEMKRCIVWRDFEMRTPTMSCDSDSDILSSY